MSRTDQALLEIRNLEVAFRRGSSLIPAVRGLDLHVKRGEVLGIVGESGSGKSLAMLASLGLAAKSAVISGSVRFKGQELIGRSKRELQAIRGSAVGMIFQDPLSSLNPVLTVGDQITEALLLHNKHMSQRNALDRAVELLGLVSITQPDRRIRQYPHEFSGGMRQRVMIAMSIANNPELIVADEPTTALDVTVQAQIMHMLRELKSELGLALVLITHDLGLVAGHADRVAVVYAGMVVEQADVYELFREPRHPYTRGLSRSIPGLDSSTSRLYSIGGAPPMLGALPTGCAFHPRCPFAQDICRVVEPPIMELGGHQSACHFADSLPAWNGRHELGALG